MKNQSGVSLITLVITIVVAIILAAIALGSGVLDMGARAQFTGFSEKISTIGDDIRTAAEDANTLIAQTGVASKSLSQRLNFVARGGNINDFAGDNENKWLTVAQADAYVSLVDPNGAKTGAIISGDRAIKVETPAAGSVTCGIFVTPKGNVFCWPPFINDGRAYVNVNTVAKDGSNNDLDTMAKVVAADCTIKFTNGETVTVKHEAVTPDTFASMTTVTNPMTVFFVDAAGNKPSATINF